MSFSHLCLFSSTHSLIRCIIIILTRAVLRSGSQAALCLEEGGELLPETLLFAENGSLIGGAFLGSRLQGLLALKKEEDGALVTRRLTFGFEEHTDSTSSFVFRRLINHSFNLLLHVLSVSFSLCTFL